MYRLTKQLVLMLVVISATIGCFARVSYAQESAAAQKLRLDKSNPKSPAIYFGDRLITQYIPESGNKPIFYPMQTVSGHRVTRNYPMSKDYPFEKNDHVHHRSFWFSYGSINDLDFWSEEAEEKQGYIVSTNLESKAAANAIVLETDWEWHGPDRVPIAHSKQQFQFSLNQNAIQIEATIRLRATTGDLRFGDTKEGAFAVRVGELMKLEAKAGGHIVNDQGVVDDGTWGRTARWVQYTGPAQQEGNPVDDPTKLGTAGITMLVHPTSFGYPGRWHVRGYGLFAHNPVGIQDFIESQDVMDDQEKARQGGFTLKSGDEFFLRYLVLLHDGALEKTQLENIWKNFSSR